MQASNDLDRESSGDEVVVLLHGLISHKVSMSRLAKHLEAHGYRSVNWGYVSFFDSIPKHAQRLRVMLNELDADSTVAKIHFVTHSMGGIIVRAALPSAALRKAGRFVMLSPPNQGSHVARICSKVTRSAWPSLQQLSDRSGSFVNELPPLADVEVGIVTSIPDHVVPTGSTDLPGAVAHTTVKGPHRVVPYRRHTRELVLSFLQTGSFNSDP